MPSFHHGIGVLMQPWSRKRPSVHQHGDDRRVSLTLQLKNQVLLTGWKRNGRHIVMFAGHRFGFADNDHGDIALLGKLNGTIDSAVQLLQYAAALLVEHLGLRRDFRLKSIPHRDNVLIPAFPSPAAH
ncbi:Uncharacterised protein [Actinobacillus pleuropneumoniae]|nr:Uncharacterised protein [Actinobacillus pleuropneumoniae]